MGLLCGAVIRDGSVVFKHSLHPLASGRVGHHPWQVGRQQVGVATMGKVHLFERLYAMYHVSLGAFEWT